MTLNDLGNVTLAQGDYAAALDAYEKSLEIFQELGNDGAVANALGNLGNTASAQKDHGTARARYAASLAIVQKMEDKRGIARSLENFAGLAIAQSQPERAIGLLASAAALRETIGAPRAPLDQSKVNHALEMASQSVPEQTIATLWATGRALTLEQAIAFALEGDVLPETGNRQV
jgi:tetratricopeptide (TPR) repeat protein